MANPLAAALAKATPEQAQIVWEALSQWIDNSDPELDEVDPERHQAAINLQANLDAAFVGVNCP